MQNDGPQGAYEESTRTRRRRCGDGRADRDVALPRGRRIRDDRGTAQCRPDQVPTHPSRLVGDAREGVGRTAVYDILRNPKYTWLPGVPSPRARSIRGKVNDPVKWVWSPQPTHEPLTANWVRDKLDAGHGRRSNARQGDGPSTHPQTRRTYVCEGWCSVCVWSPHAWTAQPGTDVLPVQPSTGQPWTSRRSCRALRVGLSRGSRAARGDRARLR